MKKLLFFVIVMLLVVVSFLFLVYVVRSVRIGNNTQREVERLKVELSKAQHYTPMKIDTIRDSVVVYSQDVELISKQAYKRELADKKLIKDLRMKISRMESEQTLDVVTHDTVYLQAQGDSVYGYKDKWVSFRYDVPKQLLDYSVKDSIATYVEKIPKHKFLWWHWGVKGYKVKVANFNPHSTILHNDYYHLAK